MQFAEHCAPGCLWTDTLLALHLTLPYPMRAGPPGDRHELPGAPADEQHASVRTTQCQPLPKQVLFSDPYDGSTTALCCLRCFQQHVAWIQRAEAVQDIC